MSQHSTARSQIGITVRSVRIALVLAAVLLFSAAPALADPQHPDDQALQQARFDQRLNEQVALDVQLRDETGATVQLGDYLGAKPVLLVPVYYNCPNLCDSVLHDLLVRLRELRFDVGREFEVVLLSIDPRETPALAASKKQDYLREYGRAQTAAGWHVLTGDQPQIARLAATIGMHYAYDPRIEQFSHPSGLIVLTPHGKISKYFYGLEYSTTDLRLGLVEASANRIGTPIDQVLLRCYHYDPVTGRYSFAVIRLLQYLGSATVLIVGGVVVWSLRRERGAAVIQRRAAADETRGASIKGGLSR